MILIFLRIRFHEYHILRFFSKLSRKSQNVIFGKLSENKVIDVMTITVDEMTILKIKARSHCHSNQVWQSNSHEMIAKKSANNCAARTVSVLLIKPVPFLFSCFLRCHCRFSSLLVALPCKTIFNIRQLHWKTNETATKTTPPSTHREARTCYGWI